MTAQEAYKNLLLKVNKNDTNADVDISRGEFTLLFNEQKDRWLDEKIDEDENTDEVQELEQLQVKHKSLIKDKALDLYTLFLLPDNYFSYISSYSICSNGACSNAIVRNFPFKPKNENMLLESSNMEPSIEFEETIVDLSNNRLFVYKKDFEVDKVYLNYYKVVDPIDVAGYVKLDGTQSVDVNPTLSDIYVDEILNRCAKEVIRRYENPQGFELAAERLIKE